MKTLNESLRTVAAALLAALLAIGLPTAGYVVGQLQIVMGCLAYKKFDYRVLSFDCAVYTPPAALTDGGKK